VYNVNARKALAQKKYNKNPANRARKIEARKKGRDKVKHDRQKLSEGNPDYNHGHYWSKTEDRIIAEAHDRLGN
jgi:hypothetical protein